MKNNKLNLLIDVDNSLFEPVNNIDVIIDLLSSVHEETHASLLSNDRALIHVQAEYTERKLGFLISCLADQHNKLQELLVKIDQLEQKLREG